jgi:uncharacterized alpha-E superfamily protein
MLSRVADSLYWINRYVERADNFARFLEISIALALDSGDEVRNLWQPLLETSGVADLFRECYLICNASNCCDFLARRVDNPSSITSCLAAARENARQIRDRITTEVWEQLNELHWTVQDASFWEQPLQEALRDIRRGCELFYGVMDATQSRDHAWDFGQLGRWMERADKTSRLLDANWLLTEMPHAGLSSPLPEPVMEELHWTGVLRCLGGYQMYRQQVSESITAASVSAYLLLDERFPRSVAHCIEAINRALRGLVEDAQCSKQLQHLDQLLDRLSDSANTRQRLYRLGADLPQRAQELSAQSRVGELEWLAGLLQARWMHLSMVEMLSDGIHDCIDELQADLNQLDALLHQRYLMAEDNLELAGV